MSQFKKPEEYASIAPSFAADPVLNTMFVVQTNDGPCRIGHKGTTAVLEEILRRYNVEGLTVHTVKGFTWFPVTSIKKVDVEILTLQGEV